MKYAVYITFLTVLTQSLKSDDSGTENSPVCKTFYMGLKSQWSGIWCYLHLSFLSGMWEGSNPSSECDNNSHFLQCKSKG